MKRFFEYSYTFFGYAVIIVFTIVLCAIVALITTALITNPSRESDLANGVIPFFALFLTAPLWFSASIYCPFVAHHSFANPLRSLKRIFVCVSVPTGISFFSTALLSLLLVSRKWVAKLFTEFTRKVHQDGDERGMLVYPLKGDTRI